MQSKKLRILSLLLILAMAFGLFAGCSKDEAGDKDDQPNAGDDANKPSDDQPSGNSGKDSIVIATMSETPSLSPTDHNATAGSYMNLLTYSTLFNSDVEMNPQPLLVESYENISDTVWEFKLRQGVKYHNGETMTVEDVKASLDYAKTCPEISLYNDCIESVEIVDEQTFRITTPGPSAVLLNHLGHHGNAIVPKALLDAGHDFATDPVGSGPYKLVEWKRGDSVEFEAFEDYFLGEAPIKHMTWKIIPEGSSRTIALEAGEIDFIVEVEAMDYDRLSANDDVAIYEYSATEHNWMMLNNEKPGLDNVNVRKAIDCAVDKEAIVTVALNGMGEAIYSHAPNNLPGASEENVNSHDPEKAKEYMAASGVDPASVQLAIICSNDTKKRAAEVIQANLKEIGVNAQIESMDLATYLSATDQGNYTASIGGFTANNPMSYCRSVYHSSSINASNTTRLNHAEVDELIDRALVTLDDAARKEIIEELSNKLNEICPQAPLYQPLTVRAHRKGLEGVEINGTGTLYFENVHWAQ